VKSEDKLMAPPVKKSFLIILVASLVLGTSFAQFQENPSNKRHDARSKQQKQEEGAPAPEILGHWQALASRSKELVAVSWNKRSGTPKSIFGKIPAGNASEKSARSFLSQNASLFKLNNTADLDLERDFESTIGKHIIFDQHYRGVPVYGAQMAVHFNRNGEIIAVNNTYEPAVALDSVEPRFSSFRATVRASMLLGSNPSSPSSAKLVVYGVNDSFALAWRIEITDGPTWEVFVDANDGRLLSEPVDINRYATGTGQVYRVNAIVATQDNSLRDNGDAASAVPASAYMVVTLQGLDGNGFLDGAFASSAGTKKRVSDPGNLFMFDRSNDGFSETMGYYYLDYAQRYIQSLGFNNVNNRQQVFSVNRFKQDNSFYSPSSKELTFGLGGVDDAEDAEVILHEYGHSIQDNQVPGFGRTLEAGAMGEGFGDYWAGSVSAQFSGGFQDLCLAEWDATSYSNTNPPCLRRLDSPKHYPENVAGEVHRDGEIWSAALWQIRDSIGTEKADRVIITAHFLLTPTASFNEGANAIVTTAINLGYKNGQINSIRNILRSRGFTVTV
jgi:Zn-dependent metalloprotease